MANLDKLVVKSTTAVYGSSPRDPALFTEDAEPKSLPKSGYGKIPKRLVRDELDALLLGMVGLLGPGRRLLMSIPQIDLKRQHEALRAELIDASARVLDSCRFVLGPEVQTLDPKTGEWVNYPLPRYSNLRRAFVDQPVAEIAPKPVKGRRVLLVDRRGIA